MEFGICTFGDLAPGDSSPTRAQRCIDEIVAAARIADAAGLDVFGVCEHIAPTSPCRRRLWYWARSRLSPRASG